MLIHDDPGQQVIAAYDNDLNTQVFEFEGIYTHLTDMGGYCSYRWRSDASHIHDLKTIGCLKRFFDKGTSRTGVAMIGKR
jgi:hypothetical protein